jgi:hypothetical protein
MNKSLQILNTYHGNHRPRAQEITQAIEKWALLQIIVVLGSKLLGGYNQLDSHQLVTLSFESPNNF